jgi:hypothetical protein
MGKLVITASRHPACDTICRNRAQAADAAPFAYLMPLFY